MDREGWLERVANVRRWTRDGVRAPHKPLLMLFALGRLQRLGSSRVSFADAEPVLQTLLDEFGPANRKTSPAYPFHHLRTDGLWVVTTDDGSEPGASPTRLRATATGAFAPDFEAALRSDPTLAALASRTILDGEFPESLHSEICAVAGLDVEGLEVSVARERVVGLDARRRSPRFRDDVLVAYEYRCAVCGFDGWLGRETVGLDAAHVRWWAFDGPDSVDNGMCLCVLHHNLFDRGVIGLSADLRVTVSRRFVGRSESAQALVLALVDRPLFGPQAGEPPPGDDFVRWHGQQVFQAPARAAS